jgi:chromate transport protein ChrA
MPVTERGSALEVLGVATRLGLTSFGGPVAHLGYSREEYVFRAVPAWLVVVIAALGGAALSAAV